MDLWEKISASIRARVFGWSKTRWPGLPITDEDRRFSRLMKGQIGGRYRPEVSLFGQCFRAVDETDGSLVILKILPDEPDGQRLLSHEFDVCTRFTHKNIIRYDTMLSEDGFTILVARHREAAEFQSIAGPPAEVSLGRDKAGLAVFHQLQDGLDYLHGQGMVHAGLARDSVVIGRSGEVTIVNLVHCCEAASGRSASGEVVGGKSVSGVSASNEALDGEAASARPLSPIDDHERLMHGSPEHLTGRLLPESDYFAVGILMFEYLLRRHPFWRTGLMHSFDLLKLEGADKFLVDPKLYNADRKILGLLFASRPDDRREGWELLRSMQARR